MRSITTETIVFRLQLILLFTSVLLVSVTTFTSSPLSTSKKAINENDIRFNVFVCNLSRDNYSTDPIISPKWRTIVQQSERSCGTDFDEEGEPRRRRPPPCPQPDDDPLQDRREAIFASIGSIWAISSGILSTNALIWPSQPASAEYGADAKIELPNPIQGVADRSNKQCLVESLGNRECLVYEDPENKLYQGTNAKVLLLRIEPAIVALATIPDLAESKKWSKVTSVMTGPMGELIRTMGQLSVDNTNAQKLVQAVKNDLYALQEAVNRKDGALVLQYHAAATRDMAAFANAL